MDAKKLEEFARSLLKWYDLNEDHPAYARALQRGGCVSMLALTGEGEPNALANVARLTNGLFWTFENNPMVVCRRYSGQRFQTLQAAKDDVYSWVLSEVIRVMKSTMSFKHKVISAFKQRDKEAHEEYLKDALMTVIFGKDTSFAENFKRGFKAGVDWVLRSEGVTRHPAWANYIVQNRDGSQTWFEHEPSLYHNGGYWICATGRHLTIQVHPESWVGSLRKLT